MNVSLTAELEQFVYTKVQSGRYTSPSEVIQEALRLLEEREAVRTRQVQEFRSRVDEGLAALALGESTDGEAFMSSILSNGPVSGNRTAG